MQCKKILVAGVLFCTAIAARAQRNDFPPADTLKLTLDSAESRFLRQNLALLAQRYNIDATKALVIQEKLYPNPNFSVSTTLYNGDARKWFPAPFTDNGELSGGITQTILLARKRNKAVKLAEANVKLAEYEFYDLLRTLKYTLRTDFFTIYYLQQSAKVYDTEIQSLQQITKAFAEQQGKGYIAEKEVVRIQAQLYSMQSEYNDLLNQLNDTQSELRLILQEKKLYISPVVDDNTIALLNPLQYSLSALIDTAYKSRTDLMIARANTDINQLNYNYQKSLAVPDLSANIGYDQQGSYIRNFSSVGIAVDLPFFNRNQGNIKNAKKMIDVSIATQKSTEATVEENVYRSLQKALDADKLYKNINPEFSENFERLMREVLTNYQKRNISLLDFLDFYDSYKQNTLQVNSIKLNRVNAFEEINFYTGNQFFN
ncbi:MAG: TolC family protein [Chitinophagaceae bacterium]|jgi:cobalt-zinc-cadmium efflux system outer membrane protein|nr:TolC family protein [Chitinophagaceae bacterium]